MLTNLVKVEERILESAANGGHSSQGGTLELLALEERLCIFEETDVIARHNLDQMLCGRELTEGDSEMVCIVQSIEEILVEWVDILKAREPVQDQRKLLGEGLLGELDLSSIEILQRLALPLP